MSLRWYTLVVDCRDVKAQGRWWAEVLGWRVIREEDDEVVIVPPRRPDGTAVPREERGPALVFVSVPEAKTVKNRLHIDLAASPGGDLETEVRRLESAGARRADIGQGDVDWVVMTDPEGNEFCVLSPPG